MNVFQKINNFYISEIFIILILITLPLGFAVNSISIILFLLLAIYTAFVKGIQNKPNSLNLVLISFYVLCILSLFWTDNITNTKIGLVRFLAYITIPIAFFLNQNINIDQTKIVSIFSKTLVFYALYCLIVGFIKFINTKDISYLFYHKLSGNLSNMNAIYLSVFISFGIAYFLNKKIKSKIDILCCIFLSIFLILLSSKTIITITLIFAVFLYFKKFELKKITLKYKVAITVILLIFSITSINFIDRIKTEFSTTKLNEVLNKKDFGHVYIWTGTGLRVFQIKAFTEILSEEKNYLLGSGLNNSQENLNKKYKEYNFYPGFLNYNYHNQYIQIVSELGLLGLFLISLIFFFLLKKAFFYKDYFFVTFIFLILVVCITESFLWRQRGMVFFLTISLLFYNKKKLTLE